MVVNSPANKISSREQVLASMKDGSGLNYSSLKGTTESFTVYGNIAIEMGHEDFVMAAGPAAGKPLQRRFTNVWQRSGDVWLQIARQATILNADAAWVYGAPLLSPKLQQHSPCVNTGAHLGKPLALSCRSVLENGDFVKVGSIPS